MRVPWSEFWPFLDEFANFSSDQGLQKLETYLQEQSKDASTLRKLDNDLEMIESQFRNIQLNTRAHEMTRNASSSEPVCNEPGIDNVQY